MVNWCRNIGGGYSKIPTEMNIIERGYDGCVIVV